MNEAAIFTAKKIFQQDAEGKRQFRERVDAVFFQLFEAMNLKGLRADVELVASAKRIACGNGHSLSFRISAQLYMIAENEKRRGRLVANDSTRSYGTKMIHRREKLQGCEDSAHALQGECPVWEIDNVCYACLGKCGE